MGFDYKLGSGALISLQLWNTSKTTSNIIKCDLFSYYVWFIMFLVGIPGLNDFSKCDLKYWFLVTFLEFYKKVNRPWGDTYSLESSISAIDDLFKLFLVQPSCLCVDRGKALVKLSPSIKTCINKVVPMVREIIRARCAVRGGPMSLSSMKSINRLNFLVLNSKIPSGYSLRAYWGPTFLFAQ